MKRIRGGSGLGDALYVRVIAEHFVRLGEHVVVCSDQSDAFIGSGAEIQAFRRDNIDVVAHYTMGKNDAATTQWQDVCKSAGVPGLPLRFDWTPRNQPLIDNLRARAEGRPIVIVHGGRAPMARTDGFGAELLPNRRAFDLVLDTLDDCFLVRIGKGPQLYEPRVDFDLCNKTAVSDLMDMVSICDGVVGQCSFVVPLAECFEKPLLAVWAERGFSAPHIYVRQITPQKVLSGACSMFVIDHWSDARIVEVAQQFRTTRMVTACAL